MTNDLRFCTACGFDLQDNTFCEECGTRANHDMPPSPFASSGVAAASPRPAIGESPRPGPGLASTAAAPQASAPKAVVPVTVGEAKIDEPGLLDAVASGVNKVALTGYGLLYSVGGIWLFSLTGAWVFLLGLLYGIYVLSGLVTGGSRWLIY